MGIEFLRPLFLLIIPIGIIILILLKKNFNIWRKCVIIVLMLLSAAGTQLRLLNISLGTSTVFLVDASSSVKQKIQQSLEFVNSAVENKKSSDETALVVFGKTASKESELSYEKKEYDISSVVDETQTNIDDALSLAYSALGKDGKKRIVLISDGMQTMKDAEKQAYTLAGNGVKVDTFEVKESFDEVQISRIDVRKNIALNSEYKIGLVIDSNTDTQAELKIYKNDKVFKTESIEIKNGRNNFEYDDTADEGGIISIKAEIKPDKDTFSENNINYAVSFCGSSAQILVVGDDSSVIGEIFPNADIHTVLPEQAPKSINDYDAVVINNCSADDMNKDFVSALEDYVKNSGGLMVTGGENAFAPGNYKDTVFDEILPVSSEVKDDKRTDDMGVMVLIDRSGSMDGDGKSLSKLEIAKEAVIRSAYLLNENDSFGVIAFDDGAEVIVPYEKTDTEKIESLVSGISVGGGTNIKEALREGFAIMKKSDANIRHIILITDGQDSQKGSEYAAKSIKQAGITLSTIAVGSDADNELLEKIAENGGGRYYYTSEFTDLPQIMVSETMAAGKNYISNEPFIPITSEGESLAVLGGYIRTQIKPRAEMSVITPDGYPVMAAMQYGLGRTAVFTSDIQKQSDEFFADEASASKFKDVFSYVMRNRDNVEYDISAQTDGERIKLVFKSESEPKAADVFKDGETLKCEFSMTNKNEYSAYVDFSDMGSYGLNISMEDGKTISTGFCIAYSAEFNILDTQGKSVLNKISEITGGKVLENPDEVFYDIESSSQSTINLEAPLAALAAILFIAELIGEKVPKKPKKPKRDKDTGKKDKKRKKEKDKEESTAFIGELLSNKKLGR